MTLTKRTEFVHLFELFDKLASRRSRHATNNNGESSAPAIANSNETHTLNIPMDLEPIFQNLANIVGSRTSSLSRSRGRATTVGHSGPPSDADSVSVSDRESTLKFPMRSKNYRFTFKMMLHKLYGVEDWGKKVKDILEKSQSEFKSLAEREEEEKQQERDAKEDAEPRSAQLQQGVEFGNVAPPRRAGRTRSHTVTAAGGGAKGKVGLHSDIRVPPTTKGKKDDDDDVRAVKKRCIGRRKSMSGLNAGEKAVWFYEAAVASSERNDRWSALTKPTTPTKSSIRSGAVQTARTKKVAPRRRVSSAAATSSGSTLNVDTRNMRRRRAVSVATRGHARNTAAMD